jgi:hypothetical protein
MCEGGAVPPLFGADLQGRDPIPDETTILNFYMNMRPLYQPQLMQTEAGGLGWKSLSGGGLVELGLLRLCQPPPPRKQWLKRSF